MAEYNFVTLWRFRAPVASVWDALSKADEWPAWWRGVERVETIEKGAVERRLVPADARTGAAAHAAYARCSTEA